MTSTERAVRKASGARLLRDFTQAARLVANVKRERWNTRRREALLNIAGHTRSRTKYACLMTAFGL